MNVVSAKEMQTLQGPEDWFTGRVWLDRAYVPTPGAGFFRVLFEPGARTNWHTHPEGQYLHIVTGEGRAATEGGPVEELKAGDTVFFAPGEKHWHGAGPNSYMVHVAINPAINSGGGTDWMEPVTDAQYAGFGVE